MKSFFHFKEETTQVTVGDYTTKHFDMCPSAVKLYSKIKNMTVMVHLIVENMMLHDVFFRLEKQAVAQGAIDEDDLEKAQEYADLIMDNARQMNLEKEHSYIEDVHMPKFDKLAGATGDEEDMNEKTLTPAELKKREEIAKSIERDNPNMPMGKKMAIATATAKRVAEERVISVKESTSTDKLKILARAGLVDQKNVERLIAAFKMLEAGKVLSTQQKDLILSSYGELASIVTGDSMTFQKAKKAVAEAVFREEWK
jgi:hypothetical protein